MRFMKAIPATTIAAFLLAACGTGTPAPIPTATRSIPTLSSEEPPIIRPQAPKDTPVYWNTFEDVMFLPSSGITSVDGQATITSENLAYEGGRKALEVTGTLPPKLPSTISLDFSIKKLTGEETIDLSNKSIGYSAFIPADSPIENISVFAGRNGQFAHLAGITMDAYWTKGAWHDIQFDLTKVQGVPLETDTIRIAGQRLSEMRASAEAYMLVDDLNWIGIDINHVPVDDSVDSLRKYAAGKHFKFGLWAWDAYLFGDNDHQQDPWLAYMAVQEGSINTIGGPVLPSDEYAAHDYSSEGAALWERQAEFGEGNHMAIMGYGIGGTTWQADKWLRGLAFPDDTRAYLLHHVENELRSTIGKEPVWYVFNEPIIYLSGNGYGLKNLREQEYNYSPWAMNRTDFRLIQEAFRTAYETDNGARLMLNDGSNEDAGWERSDLYFQTAIDLRNAGAPINGVGFQLHNYIDPDGNLVVFRELGPSYDYEHTQRIPFDVFMDDVEDNVRRYDHAGLKVAFSEVECQILTSDLKLNKPGDRAKYEERLQWQAKYYARLMEIALKYDNVILFNLWTETDRYPGYVPAYVSGYGDGAILDRHYHPKPAYYAMLELLKNH